MQYKRDKAQNIVHVWSFLLFKLFDMGLLCANYHTQVWYVLYIYFTQVILCFIDQQYELHGTIDLMHNDVS